MRALVLAGKIKEIRQQEKSGGIVDLHVLTWDPHS